MTPSKKIHFYVIIPVYNAEKYIEKCLMSVFSQTYQHFHVIAVDDGSTDRSGEICDSMASIDKRLTVIHQENKGQIAAKQAGIAEVDRVCSHSGNEYMISLDSDDWLETNAMEILAAHLEEKDCDCLIYGFQRVKNDKIVYRTPEEPNNEVFSAEQVYGKLFGDSIYNSLCRKAIRLSCALLAERTQCHYIVLGEDLLHTLDILKQVKTISFISDHLYNYRVNSASVTESVNYSRFDFKYTVQQKLLVFIRERSAYNDSDWDRQWLVLSGQLYRDIIRLLFSDHQWKDKRLWLKKIISSDYVQKELSPNIPYDKLPKNKCIVLRCALKQRYNILRGYYLITKCVKRLFNTSLYWSTYKKQIY